MKCKNCIAFGEDAISRLCPISYAESCPSSYHGVENINSEYGCRLRKKTIEKCKSEILEDSKWGKRIKFFRDDWGK